MKHFKNNFESIKTAFRRYEDREYPEHGNLALTREEELRIVGIIEAFDFSKRPLSIDNVITLAKGVFLGRLGVDARRWHKGFVRRHQEEIALRSVKGLNGKRIGIEVLDVLTEFVEWCPAWKDAHGVTDDCQINSDETRVAIRGQFITNQRLITRNHPTQKVSETRLLLTLLSHAVMERL